jgi:hypothetical protein
MALSDFWNVSVKKNKECGNAIVITSASRWTVWPLPLVPLKIALIEAKVSERFTSENTNLHRQKKKEEREQEKFYSYI